jgi:hypothetical protein
MVDEEIIDETEDIESNEDEDESSEPLEIDDSTEDDDIVEESDENKELLNTLNSREERSLDDTISIHDLEDTSQALIPKVIDNTIKQIVIKDILNYALMDLFSSGEIEMMHHYVESVVSSSILNNIVVLTDKLEEKARIYLAVFRIMNSVKNYVSGHTKEKLDEIIKINYPVYSEINKLIAIIEYSTIKFQKQRVLNRLMHILQSQDNLLRMNAFIDLFFILIEKQTKYDLDKITGIDLETEEGKAIYKDIKGVI